MVAKKRKSKRQTLQQKYKIVKRVQEHKKRLKKGVLVGKNNKKSKIDRIPNAWPYKDNLLKEIQVAKEKMEDMRQRQKEKRQDLVSEKRKKLSEKADDEPKSGAIDVVDQESSDEQEDEADGSFEPTSSNLGQNSRRAYLGDLRKVIERADVVLQVLDARDPIGTKSTAVEEMVLSHHRKKLVYVLNKCDLVPKDVLAEWLLYLRRSHPTIPFKSNTQSQKGNLGSAGGKVSKQQDGALQSNHAVGTEELLGLLKNYARVGETKSIISVGIVGFPNVGKSSLINSLMRTRSVGVSATPGFTKTSQEVILDKNIRLIDSPGIVFADGDSAATVLRNCVNVEEMEDVYTPVQAILERCPAAYLMQLYCIPVFSPTDVMSFLALVAKVTGKLKKGGIPNTDAAARGILHDWNFGKIKFYCKPPKVQNNVTLEKESRILNSFSEGLAIDQLKDEDMRVIDELKIANSNQQSFVAMNNLDYANV